MRGIEKRFRQMVEGAAVSGTPDDAAGLPFESSLPFVTVAATTRTTRNGCRCVRPAACLSGVV